jgi:hypothetical protein
MTHRKKLLRREITALEKVLRADENPRSSALTTPESLPSIWRKAIQIRPKTMTGCSVDIRIWAIEPPKTNVASASAISKPRPSRMPMLAYANFNISKPSRQETRRAGSDQFLDRAG